MANAKSMHRSYPDALTAMHTVGIDSLDSALKPDQQNVGRPAEQAGRP